MKNGKLRVLSDGRIAFYCKGCKCYHAVNIDSSKSPYWGFNGNYDKPTFTPSILVRSGHYLPEHNVVLVGAHGIKNIQRNLRHLNAAYVTALYGMGKFNI